MILTKSWAIFRFQPAALFSAFFLVISINAFAGIEGSISGTVLDSQGVAAPNAKVDLLKSGKVVREVLTTVTGDFQIFPVVFGDYEISIQVEGSAPFRTEVQVTSGGNTNVPVQLLPATPTEPGKEMVLQVRAKRHMIQNSASTSSVHIDKEDIATMPQGEQISLPQLLSQTSPGVVAGPFGQTFFRGNHANIQYQIDGVQLPDSPAGTFGETFSPRNIDHMEVITGGIPAEYGERLAAVVNIVTKSGPEEPGGAAEVNYGTYNRFSPQVTYGGSSESGNLHYYLSANYNQTDRGLDTAQPLSSNDVNDGGPDYVHDQQNGNNEFAKIDWLADNNNKLTFVFYNSYGFFQIPNWPAFYNPATNPSLVPFFTNNDPFYGNPAPIFINPNTNDSQAEINSYVEAIWKHTFSPTAFLQTALYYRYSNLDIGNDPTNDLANVGLNSTGPSATQPPPSSLALSRHTNNIGLKGDYSNRPNESNLVKLGYQFQASRSDGSLTLLTQTSSTTDDAPNTGYLGAVYAQDDWTISKSFILNAGVRVSATQYILQDATPLDGLIQPRIGLNYILAENTKFHIFYGKLFQPAPLEDLRDTFVAAGGTVAPYDIKAEKDDYYEFGVAHQFGDKQIADVNIWYRDAINMLDDTQLLNTAIAEPYNYASGYAYGLEASVHGQITEDLSEFVNYSFETAKGQGITGGSFAFTAVNPAPAPGVFTYLDHVQIHTLNSGLSFRRSHFWSMLEGDFGSGLRTGNNNSLSLPSHFTVNATVGYEFHGASWLSKFKVSLDVLNIFGYSYPITIANGFTGSHYAAGTQFFAHLVKEL